MKTLLVALAVTTLLLTASCKTGTQRPDQTLHDTCWIWSTDYLETVLSVAGELRRDDPMASAFLIGGEAWPATTEQRLAIGNAGYHACMDGLATSFDSASGYHAICERQGRDNAAGKAAWILKAQARRAGLTGAAPSGALANADRVTAFYVDGYAACMAEHAP